MWLIWVTSIWAPSQWSALQEAQQRRLFWIINNARDLAPQMATHTIYAYSRCFWCGVCGQKTCRAPGFIPKKIPWNIRVLGRKKFAGVDLIWDYTQKHSVKTCRLSIKIYIAKLLFKVGHKPPVKKQLSPHRCREITYVSKVQQAPKEYSSPALDEKGVLRVQRIVGDLLYYSRAVNNNLLVVLSAIGAQ